MIKKKVAIFASGTGSNAVNLIKYFSNVDSIEIAFVLSNNSNAPIIGSANELGVKTITLTNAQAADAEVLIANCKEHDVDWIVLAGYLRLIPVPFIQAFENKIINLHPSLLPKYGGKGMYGRNVHLAVLENNETETGITIHYVNEKFDEGKIIAQFHCAIDPNDTIQDVEGKIRRLEHGYLPFVVHQTILN